MPKLIVSLPDSGEVTHELSEPAISVGRISDNLLQIEDISVSSHHATLTVDESGDYILQDIGSTNGTALNGKDIAEGEDHKLQDGDKIRFGKIETSYTSENPAEARPLPEAEEVAAVVGATSTRPADFSNASPFQKKKKKADGKGVGILVASVLVILGLGYVISQVYAITSPAL